jgi:hypothetical protein
MHFVMQRSETEMKESERSSIDRWDTLQHLNLRMMSVPKVEKIKGNEMFEETVPENFIITWKTNHPHIQEAS